MHGSHLRFKDIILSSRFKGFAGLDTTEPPIVTCGSKKVPGQHGHPPVNHLGWWAKPCDEGVCNTLHHLKGGRALEKPTATPTALWAPLNGLRLWEKTQKKNHPTMGHMVAANGGSYVEMAEELRLFLANGFGRRSQ